MLPDPPRRNWELSVGVAGRWTATRIKPPLASEDCLALESRRWTSPELDGKPHAVAERDSICRNRRVAPVGGEGVSLNAIHAEPQPLVEPEVLDIGCRRADDHSSAAFRSGASKNSL